MTSCSFFMILISSQQFFFHMTKKLLFLTQPLTYLRWFIRVLLYCISKINNNVLIFSPVQRSFKRKLFLKIIVRVLLLVFLLILSLWFPSGQSVANIIRKRCVIVQCSMYERFLSSFLKFAKLKQCWSSWPYVDVMV